MGAYLCGRVNQEWADRASAQLENHPLNNKLKARDLEIVMISSKDVEWAKTQEHEEPEVYRRRMGSFDIRVTTFKDEEDAEELYEIITQILEELSKNYRAVYSGDVLDVREPYFTMEQMRRITANGTLLTGSFGDAWRDRREHRRLLRRLQGISFDAVKTLPERTESEREATKVLKVSEGVKEFFANNGDFYPTPEALAYHLLDEIDYSRRIKHVLEPSAGKGDLIAAMKSYSHSGRFGRSRYTSNPLEKCRFRAIESDPDLQAVLRGKDIPLLDSDFLGFNGGDVFDLIVMNPPFSAAEHHLHKALDLMFSGQVAAIMPAEVFLNPHTLERQRLIKRLKELGADIQYIEGAFGDAQRKTAVDVALVYVNIIQSVEDTLFADEMETVKQEEHAFAEEKEIAGFNKIVNLVIEYERERNHVMDQILSFYRNHKRVGKWLKLAVKGEEDVQGKVNTDKNHKDLTLEMQEKVNTLNSSIREHYWRKALDLEEIKRRLTSKKKKEIEAELVYACATEFTENNVRQFILNLIDKYPTLIQEAIEYMFDEMTHYALSDRMDRKDYLNGIHYFNGWKSNSAYRVNRRVIIPFYTYCSIFKRMELNFEQQAMFDDFDRIMQFFDGSVGDYDTGAIVDQALRNGQNRKIQTKYFEISVFKKGTVHILFKDEDILRQFNIAACKGRNFLPDDYAEKPYKNLNEEEKAMVDAFEEKSAKSYKPVVSPLRIGNAFSHLQLEMPKPAPVNPLAVEETEPEPEEGADVPETTTDEPAMVASPGGTDPIDEKQQKAYEAGVLFY